VLALSQIQKTESLSLFLLQHAWALKNCKELFGLGNDKEAISAAFEANGVVRNITEHFHLGSGTGCKFLKYVGTQYSDILIHT
jgi:hypothetical protein